MLDLRITRVLPCACTEGDHARVVLCPAGDQQGVALRVPATVGQAILAELGGLPSLEAQSITLLGRALQAVGGLATCVTFAGEGAHLRASLQIEHGEVVRDLLLDCSLALLAACRLRLPIHLRDSAPPHPNADGVPAVYRPLLRTLDLSGIDSAERTP